MKALACLIAGTALLAWSSGPQAFTIPPQWTEAVEPFTIAEGLHYVGSAELSSFLLTGTEGHVLIDVPLADNAQLVLDNVRRLGFDPGEIRIVLAHHAHFDHVGGIAAVLEATGAELILSEADAALTAAGGHGDFFFGDAMPYPPAHAARTVGHLETITLGEISLTAHLTPGHTRGCTSWSGSLRLDGQEVTFVSVCSLSVLPGYRLVGDDPSYPGIARDYCASERHLRSLRPDIFLAAHASFFAMHEKAAALAGGDARAFVDPERYVRYLDRAREQIEQALAARGQEGGCTTMDAARHQQASGGRPTRRAS